MAIINDRIKERRLSLGMTLLDLANILGVKEATVQRYESGAIKNIKHETITALAKALKCSPPYLMGWEASEQETPAPEDERTKEIIEMISQLTPQEKDLVIAQLKGILAMRKNHPAPDR